MSPEDEAGLTSICESFDALRDMIAEIRSENFKLRKARDNDHTELYGECIGIMREHLASVGIEATFADDAAHLAAIEIKKLREENLLLIRRLNLVEEYEIDLLRIGHRYINEHEVANRLREILEST